MKEIVEFTLSGDKAILIETEFRAEGLERVARGGDHLVRAAQTFDEALDSVRPAATALFSKLRDLVHAPDEVQISFGIKFTAAMGAVIASTEGEANFGVSLTWKRVPKAGE